MKKTFDERFQLIYPRLKAIAGRFASTTRVPYEEYESFLCEQFIAIDRSFNAKVNNSYAAYVGAMIETKAKRLADDKRSMRQFYDNLEYLEIPDDSDEDAAYPRELVADVDIEEEVFDVMFVEDQLKAAEPLTKEILRYFFANPRASFREIAREFDVDHKLVKRRLESVAKAVREA